MESNQHLEMVAQAIEYIEAHLKEPLTVQDVCALNSLSPWHFQRVFRAVVGDSVGNYIRGRRLALAAQVLRSKGPSIRILDVAIEFQFNSQEAFTRAFKDTIGTTPAEFRDNPKIRSLYAKPKLNLAKITQLKNGIGKQPQIQRLEAKCFVGVPIQISSPLGVDSEFNGRIPVHWETFDQRRQEIKSRVHGVSYGFVLSSNHNMEDDVLTYLAAVEVPVTPERVPEGMQVLNTSTQDYAVFEVAGYLESCHVTADYIYGIWLPQSGYQRGQGFDFELFDHQTYRRGEPHSISFYFVPIKPIDLREE